jgi:ribosomal protein S18 acetylase RimI-like enzyme
MNIRSIHEHELPALLNLYQYLHPSDAPLPDEATVRGVWKEILTDPRIHCLVAEANSEIAGACLLALIPNLTRGARPYGLIENVVTHGDYRRQGIGTALLHHALGIARHHNCYKVMLMTSSKSEAVHDFYEQAGFTKGIKTGFVATL